MTDKELSGKDVLRRNLIITEDGSSSLYVEGMDESYHSHKGALTESEFVFIEHGLNLVDSNEISVLEIGMGTGLNVLLSLLRGGEKTIHYHTLEPYPLQESEWQKLNYCSLIGCSQDLLDRIHNSPFEEEVEISANFSLTKIRQRLEHVQLPQEYDVVYFDAFAPSKQESPWHLDNVQKVYDHLRVGGLLTTYCAQGKFKRNLKSVGFEVTNPAGPLGKREMTIAYKRA